MHSATLTRRRSRALAPAAVLLLALCLLAVGAQAQSGSPALAISEPGRYTLDHDLAVHEIGVLITSSDVVFDGMGHAIVGAGTGTGVYATGFANATPGGPITNVTVRNVTVRDCGAGVFIGNVNGSVVEDVVAEQNGIGFGYGYAEQGGAEQAVLRDSVARDGTGTGIALDYPSDGITIERCTITGNANGLASDLSGRLAANSLVDSEVSDNAGFGISLKESGLAIRGCTISGNGANGIQLEHAGATIEANRIENNAGTGVQSTDRGGSTITSNWIVGNGQGVAVGGDWSSRVTNNVLNNTDNGFFGAAEVGQLNVTRTAGPNIVGGPELGGNFWAFPNGTGFSETHADTDGDGFCDEPFVVNPEEGVTDYLPLALPNAPPVGGDRGYFLVSTVPAGAAISLVDLSGTAYPQGTTSAGPLNVTVYLTGTPMRSIVANLSGYRDAVYTIAQSPAKGQTVPVSLTLEPVGGPQPYKPLSVPGRIQAEDYDLGGFSDTTPGNSGGAYRQDDVDIEVQGGVTNVGWIRNGEFLTYTANVTKAGAYILRARVASPNSGRTAAVSVDGTQKATIAVPNTGSFATFRTVEVPVTLAAGTHTLKLAFAGDGQNLDWIELSPHVEPTPTPTVTPTPTPEIDGTPYKPLSIPGTIQAEDYDLGGEGVAYHDTTPGNEGGAYRHDDVDIEKLAGLSTPNVGWIRDGEYLRYTVNVAQTGDYYMALRVASPHSYRNVAVLVDDGWQEMWVLVPNTGSFERFATAVEWSTRTRPSAGVTATMTPAPTATGGFTFGKNPVHLTAGTHTLKLAFSGDGQNLDWIAFAPVGVTTPTPTPTPGAGGASFAAAPLTSPKGSAVKFSLTPAAGKTIASAWWSFDAPAHLNTWNSRATNPTFFYPRAGTFSPLVKITYRDGTTETVQRTGYIRAT